MTKNPLYIFVDDNDWNAYGKLTYWNSLKMQILRKLGGISDTVSPGTYVFDLELTRKGFVVCLLPAE